MRSPSFVGMMIMALLPASAAAQAPAADVPLTLEVDAGAVEATADRQLLSGGVRAVLSDEHGPLLELVAPRAERAGAQVVLLDGVELRAPRDAAGRARQAGLLPWVAGLGVDAGSATVRAARVVIDEREWTVLAEDLAVEGAAAGDGPTLRVEAERGRLERRDGEWRLAAERVRVRLRALVRRR
jgi:hypothetical protein